MLEGLKDTPQNPQYESPVTSVNLGQIAAAAAVVP